MTPCSTAENRSASTTKSLTLNGSNSVTWDTIEDLRGTAYVQPPKTHTLPVRPATSAALPSSKPSWSTVRRALPLNRLESAAPGLLLGWLAENASDGELLSLFRNHDWISSVLGLRPSRIRHLTHCEGQRENRGGPDPNPGTATSPHSLE